MTVLITVPRPAVGGDLVREEVDRLFHDHRVDRKPPHTPAFKRHHLPTGHGSIARLFLREITPPPHDGILGVLNERERLLRRVPKRLVAFVVLFGPHRARLAQGDRRQTVRVHSPAVVPFVLAQVAQVVTVPRTDAVGQEEFDPPGDDRFVFSFRRGVPRAQEGENRHRGRGVVGHRPAAPLSGVLERPAPVGLLVIGKPFERQFHGAFARVVPAPRSQQTSFPHQAPFERPGHRNRLYRLDNFGLVDLVGVGQAQVGRGFDVGEAHRRLFDRLGRLFHVDIEIGNIERVVVEIVHVERFVLVHL